MEDKALRALLDMVMVEHPLLTDFGYGLYRKRRTPEEARAELKAEREQLVERWERVRATYEFLNLHVRHIRTINRHHTSYGLKHAVERHIGYITNGQFIAAAFMAGFKYRIHPDSPNVMFAMSERSWDKVINGDPTAFT